MQDIEKPLIGFFPVFYSIGETIPLVKIAKLYIKNGGKAVFFSHGGKYEYLARDINCEVIKLRFLWEGYIDKGKKMVEKKAPFEKIIFKVYRKEIIGILVEEEIEFFKKTGVEMIVACFNPTCNISARVLKIPLVFLNSGTTIAPFYKSDFVTYPDNYENIFTKLLPSFIKNQIAKWYLLNNKILVRDFNRVARKYKIQPFKCLNDFYLGDYTLVCDDINFLGLKPTNDFPEENYVGPIAADLFKEHKKELDIDIKNHLRKPGKSIFLIMGSTCEKKLFLKILETLNQTNYNVIAVYTTILNKEELPETNENILLKQFVPSPIMIQKMVDLAIIHGGRGTVHTTSYSGKPAIGFPMTVEHQYNIDNLVRNGAAIRVSKKFFEPQKLLNAINTIFCDYDTFLTNAQRLAKKLTKVPGEKKAYQRIIEIIQSNREK